MGRGERGGGEGGRGGHLTLNPKYTGFIVIDSFFRGRIFLNSTPLWSLNKYSLMTPKPGSKH